MYRLGDYLLMTVSMLVCAYMCGSRSQHCMSSSIALYHIFYELAYWARLAGEKASRSYLALLLG